MAGWAKGKTRQCLSGTEDAEDPVNGPISRRFKLRDQVSQSEPHAMERLASLGEGEGEGKTNLVGDGRPRIIGNHPPYVPARESRRQCRLQSGIGTEGGCSEDESVRIVVEMSSHQPSSPEGYSDGRPLVKVQISTDVAKPDPKYDGTAQGPEPRSPEDVESQIETVRSQTAGFRDAARRIFRQESAHMAERRFVNPIQHDQLRAQIQLLHVGAAQIHGFRTGGVASLQDKRHPDILNAPSGKIHFVTFPVLNHRSREGKLADAWNVRHGFWSDVGMGDRVQHG